MQTEIKRLSVLIIDCMLAWCVGKSIQCLALLLALGCAIDNIDMREPLLPRPLPGLHLSHAGLNGLTGCHGCREMW